MNADSRQDNKQHPISAHRGVKSRGIAGSEDSSTIEANSCTAPRRKPITDSTKDRPEQRRPNYRTRGELVSENSAETAHSKEAVAKNLKQIMTLLEGTEEDEDR